MNNLTENIQKLDMNDLNVKDWHVITLVNRCKNITELNLMMTEITRVHFTKCHITLKNAILQGLFSQHFLEFLKVTTKNFVALHNLLVPQLTRLVE